ncbi:MAG: BlaI/MecI/CopY family transcriptional regulator [Bacteroidia bacterium]
MKELTTAEEQIMQVLWKMEKAFVREMLDGLPEPKPAYNTVSTIVRILERKGFVGHEAFGKSHRYFPLVSAPQYKKFSLSNLLENYFDGSLKELVNFFVKQENVDLKEMDEIIRLLEDQAKEKE